MRNQRKKIWIDRFQTKLSLFIAFYFALYQFAIWALIVIERHVAVNMEALLGPGQSGLILMLTVVVVGLGLLFIYDAIRLAHRIVGPLYRFRKTIQAIKEGTDVELVTLRSGDFLQEMKDELNEVLHLLEERGAITLKRDPVKDPAALVNGSVNGTVNGTPVLKERCSHGIA